MAHLIRRVRQREISTSQLGLLAHWLATDPEVPEGRWFKRFPEMIVCGEGPLVKTFLRPGQAPAGEEVSQSELEVRDREDAIANTRDARAPQIALRLHKANDKVTS